MTQLGAAVNFAFTGTDGIAATEFTGKILLQNAELSKASAEEQIQAADGELKTRTFYNSLKKATLEYIPTGANIAAAITNTALPAIGSFINITACASMPELVETKWVVVPEPKAVGSNTGAKRITLQLEYHANITAAAS